ncbi:hypothetical protein KY285_016544 [Solanum tuberosum]|nr:hypothetical protein KY284_016556 [Solanum tuberosum]KAH0702266.1 hypothetical protein KY285_016544 [Solanum tuberosum]
MAASPSPQPMAVGETNVNPNTCRTYASAISGNQQSSEKSLKPVILLHGEPTVVFAFKDIETFITEENLKYALIAKFSHGRPELPDLRKILPQQLGFKGECNIGLLESRHVLLRFTLKEDYIAIFSKTSRSIKSAGTVIPFRIQKWTPSFSPREETSIAMAWVSFPSLPCQYFARNALFSMASVVGQPLDVDRTTYDKTRPSTARGHREADCQTLTDGQVDAMVSENHIEGEKFQGVFRDHLNAKKIDLNRLEIGETDETVKDLDVGAEKSGVQDQNLVRQTSGQRLGKAMLDDYSSGNQMLSLIPQTGESSRQSCHSVDHVGVGEQLVVHSNQQNNKSKDTQFAQKINEAIKSYAPLENLAIDGKEKIAESERGNLKPLEAIDLQVEISSCDENATGNWNTIAQKKSISMCIGFSASRSKSPRLENKQQETINLVVQSNGSKDIVCTNPFEALEVEKELELIDFNPSKEKTLVRADPDNNIQSVSTPIGVCSMRTDKYGNVMSPTVAKTIQESQAAMLLKPNSAIKPPMVT